MFPRCREVLDYIAFGGSIPYWVSSLLPLSQTGLETMEKLLIIAGDPKSLTLITRLIRIRDSSAFIFHSRLER
jgi:hypothetical protein